MAAGAPGPSRRVLLGALAAGLALPARAETPEVIAFDGLYKSFGVLGMQFSDRLLSLKGRLVTLHGYMAPPLKAESDFFVVTREPLAICPFCQSDADWPVDIVVVYLRSMSALVQAGARIAITGRLEVGSHTDGKTGFVSQIRIVDAGYRNA